MNKFTYENYVGNNQEGQQLKEEIETYKKFLQFSLKCENRVETESFGYFDYQCMKAPIGPSLGCEACSEVLCEQLHSNDLGNPWVLPTPWCNICDRPLEYCRCGEENE